MNIYQFNLQFSPEEDRIVFKLNTFNKEEFRFYLTRRFVKVLWPVLQQLMSNDLRRREPEKSHVAQAVLEFEHEKVLSQTNFTQKYSEEVTTYPLGEELILLFGIRVKQAPQGDILCLHNSAGKGIEFMVNNAFLHPFCKLLAENLIRAEWELNFPSAPQKAQTETVQPSPKVLH
ncbi:MAG: hypothetical protein BWK80_53460 [Desulfobacteraceae bacterium IS3]|nr:MAG: hypothetical protein BWK80_53460 [Desulfobacteraceae bacterium IS3]